MRHLRPMFMVQNDSLHGQWRQCTWMYLHFGGWWHPFHDKVGKEYKVSFMFKYYPPEVKGWDPIAKGIYDFTELGNIELYHSFAIISVWYHMIQTSSLLGVLFISSGFLLQPFWVAIHWKWMADTICTICTICTIDNDNPGPLPPLLLFI